RHHRWTRLLGNLPAHSAAQFARHHDGAGHHCLHWDLELLPVAADHRPDVGLVTRVGMLAHYSVVDIEDALRSASPGPPFPTVHDRAAWEAIRAGLRDDRVARIVHQAERDSMSPVPPLRATLYLDFLRT